jgi:serine/threonine protein kinase
MDLLTTQHSSSSTNSGKKKSKKKSQKTKHNSNSVIYNDESQNLSIKSTIYPTSTNVEINIYDELGRGNNGVVYKAQSNHFGDDFIVVKNTKLKENKGKDINFYCTSVVNSIDIKSIFLGCHAHIICVYGIITNERNINLIDESTIEILTFNKLLLLDNTLPNNEIYILYEYIPGKTIRQLIDSCDDINYIKYSQQILENLALLQSKNMVHLDIKPENFMIDINDNVKFIDTEFLCKKTNPECKVLGMSVSYASPESYDSMFSRAKYKDTDYLLKSDVFSCGLVIYEMIMRKKGMSSIFSFAKKMEGPELDLEFDENMKIWEPLISKMVLRDYKTRITSQQALYMFNDILSSINIINNISKSKCKIKSTSRESITLKQHDYTKNKYTKKYRHKKRIRLGKYRR